MPHEGYEELVASRLRTELNPRHIASSTTGVSSVMRHPSEQQRGQTSDAWLCVCIKPSRSNAPILRLRPCDFAVQQAIASNPAVRDTMTATFPIADSETRREVCRIRARSKSRREDNRTRQSRIAGDTVRLARGVSTRFVV